MRNLGLAKIVCIVALFCIATVVASPAQTVTTVFTFNGTDGIQPSPLVQSADGNFYGTNDAGRANCESEAFGCGTAFRVTPAGVLTTLHNFCGQGYPDCFDGSYPATGMVLGGFPFFAEECLGGNRRSIDREGG
jgi:uncharacterized repeat protein (TIGR03803 family)